ncbi:hypothetical protein [Phytohabitans flavus]|uniref:hypothetical protein n=1 Tax=Phytohabitans flavus TaxID=1076124 RepID=UPI0015644BBB|nr:hypothetical protein [Phytohabitans flavus]
MAEAGTNLHLDRIAGGVVADALHLGHVDDRLHLAVVDEPLVAVPASDREGLLNDRADQGGHRHQQELVGIGEREAVSRGHEQHEYRPQPPDREADVLGDDGEDEVAPCDAPSRAFGIHNP